MREPMLYNRSPRFSFSPMNTASPRPHRPAAPRGWIALWLVTLVFLAQLFAATQHEHESSAKAQHCVACALHAQPFAAPPPAALAAAPVSWHLVRTLLAPLAARLPLLRADWLLPLAHAPPVSLLPF